MDDASDEDDELQDQPKAGSLATLQQSIVGCSIMYEMFLALAVHSEILQGPQEAASSEEKADPRQCTWVAC